MNSILRTAAFAAAVVACIAVAGPSVTPAAAQTNITLDNLQTAYNGEQNANAKYLAFAKKADQEGYARVAQLFRAAADSERIHAGMHAKVIEQLGARPAADIKAPVVGSTQENLAEAVKGEGYETDSMYPGFLTQAKKDKNKNAMIAFERAGEVEGNHQKIYKEALRNIAAWKQSSKSFLVCQVCGNLVEKITFAHCPVCKYPASEYKAIM
jgi:rubrerythrin